MIKGAGHAFSGDLLAIFELHAAVIHNPETLRNEVSQMVLRYIAP
jgi:hypothetical protein